VVEEFYDLLQYPQNILTQAADISVEEDEQLYADFYTSIWQFKINIPTFYVVQMKTGVGLILGFRPDPPPQHFSPPSVSPPVANDGSGVIYEQLSDEEARLNLTGAVSNGTYGNPFGTIYQRGWIGFDNAGNYLTPAQWVWSSTNNNWWASPDVENALDLALAPAPASGFTISSFTFNASVPSPSANPIVQLLTSRTVVFEPIILGSITESSSVF
jgi:hypothetical protein